MSVLAHTSGQYQDLDELMAALFQPAPARFMAIKPEDFVPSEGYEISMTEQNVQRENSCSDNGSEYKSRTHLVYFGDGCASLNSISLSFVAGGNGAAQNDGGFISLNLGKTSLLLKYNFPDIIFREFIAKHSIILRELLEP